MSTDFDSPRQIIEIECKTLLNRVRSSRMPFQWSINPYRGCEHKCRYCYARRYHEYLSVAERRLNAGIDFDSKIFVKVNAPAVLRKELARRAWKREWIAIGTAVDPYQPVEGKYRLTRGILKALTDYDTPCSIVTKNSMVLRDRDVLTALTRGPGCSVSFSLTTIDRSLATQLEPDTPPPMKRLKVMEKLVSAGIDAGIMLAPILPGLTDDHHLEEVVKAAAEHGARFLHGASLRLEGSVREIYFDFLKEAAPHLIIGYQSLYRGPYAPKQYQRALQKRIDRARRRFSINHQPREGQNNHRMPPSDGTDTSHIISRRKGNGPGASPKQLTFEWVR